MTASIPMNSTSNPTVDIAGASSTDAVGVGAGVGVGMCMGIPTLAPMRCAETLHEILILSGGYEPIADLNDDEIVNVVDIVSLVNIILGDGA